MRKLNQSSTSWLLAGGLAALIALTGCEKAQQQVVVQPIVDGPVLKEEARAVYDHGLQEIVRLDRTNGWVEETCEATAKLFLDAEKIEGRELLFAAYNAAIAYHRCKDYDRAAKLYRRVLDGDEKNHRARVQLVKIALATADPANKEERMSHAIAELDRAIADSEYQSVEGLVELARLQMQRLSSTPNKDGKNDLDRARKNLQRALAVEDNYMPAFVELAANYLMSARASKKTERRAMARFLSSKDPAADQQLLELALLVASQGLRKSGEHAPLHNVAGIIYVELGDPTSAVRRFDNARKLDASFVEAHLNYAAVNLSFRGFAEAEEAYRAALALAPNDFEAHLGLALALRGQIDKAQNQPAMYEEAARHLAKARELDPSRAETYFNEAVLVEEYGVAVKGMSERKATELAISLFEQFVEKAKGNSALESTVDDVVAVPKRAESECVGAAAKHHDCKRGRIYDLKDALAFAEQNEAEQRRREEQAKTRAAAEDAG